MDKGFEIAIVYIWCGIGRHDEMLTVGTRLNLGLPWWLFGMANMARSRTQVSLLTLCRGTRRLKWFVAEKMLALEWDPHTPSARWIGLLFCETCHVRSMRLPLAYSRSDRMDTVLTRKDVALDSRSLLVIRRQSVPDTAGGRMLRVSGSLIICHTARVLPFRSVASKLTRRKDLYVIRCFIVRLKEVRSTQ